MSREHMAEDSESSRVSARTILGGVRNATAGLREAGFADRVNFRPTPPTNEGSLSPIDARNTRPVPQNIEQEFRLYGSEQNRDELIENRVESLLDGVESRGAKFEGAIGELVTALSNSITWNDRLKDALIIKVVARGRYQDTSIAAQFDGGETFTNEVTNIYKEHHQEILRTAGVREAVRILEQGDYFRKKGAGPFSISTDPDVQGNELGKTEDDHDQWVIKQKVQIAKSAAIADGSFRAFKGVGDISTMSDGYLAEIWLNGGQKFNPETDGAYIQDKVRLAIVDRFVNQVPKSEQEVLRESLENETLESLMQRGDIGPEELEAIQQTQIDKRLRADKLIEQTNKAWALGISTCHIFGVSARLDGPRLKSGGLFLDQANPTLEYIVPETGQRVILNMRTSPNSNDERERAAFASLRKNQPYLIAEAWDNALRNSFRDNWEEINFAESLGGNGARALKGDMYGFLNKEKIGERNRGRAEYLRRFGFNGAGYSMLDLTGRSSIEDQIDNLGDDVGIRNTVWAARIKGAGDFAKAFDGLLDDPYVINDVSLKALTEVVSKLGYESQRERRYHAAYLLSGLARFQLEHNKKTFGKDMRNLDWDEVEAEIKAARNQNLIDLDLEKMLRDDVLGPPVIAFLKIAVRKRDGMLALWAMLEAFAQAVVSGK